MIKDQALQFFTGKNVLVTGGTGMIGRQLVDLLLGADAYVKTVSLDGFNPNPKADHIQADLTSSTVCMEILEDIEVVFHLAAIKASVRATKEKPASCFVPTVMLNTNFLEACRQKKVEKILYTSSIGAYSLADFLQEDQGLDKPPMDEFPGMAKRIGEYQIRSYQIEYGMDNFSIVRPANVYGPGDRFGSKYGMVIPSLLSRIFAKEDPLVVYGDGSPVRDFIYSRDVAEGCILAMYHGTGKGFVNLGSGIGYSIKEVVDTLHGFLEFKHEFNNKFPGHSTRVMDISLAKNTIDYNPTVSLGEGLHKTWEWYLKNNSEDQINYFGN